MTPCYVLSNRATLEQGQTTPVRETITETLPDHVSWTFEDVCRQAVRTPSFPISCSRVGRWWYGGDEIGVAGVNDQSNTLLLGECKWTNSQVGRPALADLEALEDEVRWHGAERTVSYALFAKKGFTDPLQSAVSNRDDVHLFTAADGCALFKTSDPDQIS
jgi:AAA+ ATPase superfamily predicted ATPase